MRSLLLASVALMAGPAVPPKAPPPEDKRPPCAKPAEGLQPVRPDQPSDAQRFNPGLF